MLKTIFTFRRLFALALAASLASLAAALTSQYGFGLTPCHLCIAQRVPYAVVIILSLLGIGKPRHGTLLALLVGIAFLVGSGIAAYHTAVEKHWIEGPSGCTMNETKAVQSVDDFLKRIEAAPIVACDQPQWEFHGITMAGMNTVWSLFLCLATFTLLQSLRKKEIPHA